MLPGVDVSSFQGLPGQWQAAAGDIEWAAAKLTEYSPGGIRYANPDAAADWEYLKKQGKGRIAYMFAHPATVPAEAVSYFLQVLIPLGLEPGDGIMLDLETADGLNPGLVSIWARQVCRRLNAALKRPVLLYTYLDFAAEGNCAGLAFCPLWISDPSSPAGHPRIPAPWKTWAIHQYATAGAIDRDAAAYQSLPAMAAALGSVPAPQPVTDLMMEDPVLLNRGAAAVTPLALPDGAKAIRLLTAEGTATVQVEWPVNAAVQAVSLSWAGGTHEIPVPHDRHGVKLTRVDDGENDVSAAVCA